MKRTWRAALVTAVVAFAIFGCRSKTQTNGEAPAVVEAGLIEVATTTVPVFEQVAGTVAPELQAVVAAKVTGRISSMRAVPGMVVKAGEVLATIETPQLEAALARAEAALANANAEAERFRALRSAGSVAEREIDRVETNLRMATAERDLIRSQLDDATLAAPFAGRITRKFHDTGDLVLPGTPVCRIEDPSRLRFEMHVAESLAGRIALGTRFRVQVDAAGFRGEAAVAEISPAADAGSRTFLVKLELPQHPQLLAGQFGRAFLPRGERQGIRVPPAALVARGQLTYVAVVGGDSIARLRIVRPGAATDEGVEILAGLEPGERILAAVPPGMRSGTLIRKPQ